MTLVKSAPGAAGLGPLAKPQGRSGVEISGVIGKCGWKVM